MLVLLRPLAHAVDTGRHGNHLCIYGVALAHEPAVLYGAGTVPLGIAVALEFTGPLDAWMFVSPAGE